MLVLGRAAGDHARDAALLVGRVVGMEDALGDSLVDARGELGGYERGGRRIVAGEAGLELAKEGVDARLDLPVAKPLLDGEAHALLLLLDVGHFGPIVVEAHCSIRAGV